MSLNHLSSSAWCKLSRTAQNLLNSPTANIDENMLRLIDMFSQKQQRIMVISDHEAMVNTIQLSERVLITGDHITDESIDLIIGTALPYEPVNVDKAFNKLKPTGYIAIITEDRWQASCYELCHAKLADDLSNAGFSIQGLIVLIKPQKVLKPYGYPKTFVPNITNQFAVIARKI